MEVKDRIYQIIAKAQEKLSAHNIKLSVDESAEVTKEETAEALKFMVETALEDGTIVFTPAESWDLGVEIYTKDADGNPVAVADGDYIVADGTVISVLEGKVSAITPKKEDEVEVEVTVEAEQAEQAEVLTKQYVDDALTAITEQITELKAEFEKILSSKEIEMSEVAKELDTVKAAYSALSNQAAAVSVKQTAVKKEIKPMIEYKSAADRIKAIIANK
jgi:vacuolar-type H+-ATPase subunit I/STV1